MHERTSYWAQPCGMCGGEPELIRGVYGHYGYMCREGCHDGEPVDYCKEQADAIDMWNDVQSWAFPNSDIDG